MYVMLPLPLSSPCVGELGCPPSQEVVLEHIVERKRMDDLAGSIMDGRFQEQKVHITQPSILAGGVGECVSLLWT